MKIAFIGTGNIGNPMARHVLEAGHQMTVHDLNRESTINLEEMGATLVPTPQAAAEGSEIILTSLPGPREVEAVALGDQSVLQGASEGAIYVDLSTNSPSLARRIHREFQARGVAALDAPVSGGVPGAEAATLSIMVGGDRNAFEKASPVLRAMGDKLIYCGPPGSGMVCKICNNMVTMDLAAFLPEVLTLGVEAGVDLETVAKSITSGSGNNWVLEGKFPATLFQGNFDPGFTLNLAAKDVHLATELGRELGLPMEASNLFAQIYRAALRNGLGDLDADAVALLYESRTGTKLRFAED
jgi:3-hydroxyisobutyrate dehydrogenase-like beta-hydroxyacid dehydrogenase